MEVVRDRMLFSLAVVLTAVGVTMVYSASDVLAMKRYGDSFYFLKKDLLWAFLGLLAMLVLSRVPYKAWRVWALPLMTGSLILLVLVLVPSVGRDVHGSRRWLTMGPINFQPSEFAKLAVVLYLSHYLTKRSEKLEDFFNGLFPPLLLVGVTVMLVAAEPDLGTAVGIALVAGTLLFAGGAKTGHLLFLLLSLVPAVVALVLGVGYGKQRIMTFLDPWKDPTDAGFQTVQSLLSFGVGGLFGTGLGEGRQKLFFLPEPHTDFVFSVMGEELGLLGTGTVLLLFFWLVVRGIKIALAAEDPFGKYLATGITVMIGLQVLMNMGVATGLLPAKGLPLPLLSYGGSSLFVVLCGLGILLNVSAKRVYQ